jgi:molybdopterin-guanine dinucleotide biosynthesis protein A
MVDALVLSGGAIERERFPDLGAEIERKAQIPILGRPLVEWVVRGLWSCPRIEQIVVVGSLGAAMPGLKEWGAVVMPEASDIAENLRAGLGALSGSRRVLALSGDLPLVSRAALDDLLSHAPEADLVYPYVARADILRDFPDRDWLFARTPAGDITGSSAALCRPETLLANWPWVREILEARRSQPLGLARMVGLSFALRYLIGRLRVDDVEQKLSSQLRLVGRGYQTRFTELSMDVDKASDIPLVERVLRAREAAAGSPFDFR